MGSHVSTKIRALSGVWLHKVTVSISEVARLEALHGSACRNVCKDVAASNLKAGLAMSCI
jgi:hypothetical protein